MSDIFSQIGLNPQDILKIKKALDPEDLQKFLHHLMEISNKGGEAFVKLKEQIQKALSKLQNTSDIDEWKRSFESLGTKAAEVFNNITSDLKVWTNVCNDATTYIKDFFKAIEEGDATAEENLTKLISLTAMFTTEAAKSLGQFSAEANKITESYKDVLNLVPVAGEAFAKVAQKADFAKGFENSFMSAMAKVGEMDKVLASGMSFENMNGRMRENMDKLVLISDSAATKMGMGMSESISKTMKLIESIPDAYDKTYKIAGKEHVQAMQLLETVARGTGQTYDSVAAVGHQMFMTWNTDAKEAASRFSLISSAANDTNIPFERLRDTVQGIDQDFRMWGRSADGTIGMLKQINEILKEQGLGANAVLEIQKSLASSAERMSFDKKAFFGMEAGIGGGAAHAGLEVENMVQKGDWGKLIGMMQDVVGNMGGNGQVMNMQEALATPGGADIYLQQRMALQQFSGIGDAGMLNRIMDIMNKTQLGEAPDQDGMLALENAFNKGNTIQQHQYNDLTRIANKLENGKILVAFEALEQQQNLTGAGGKEDLYLKAQALAETKTAGHFDTLSRSVINDFKGLLGDLRGMVVNSKDILDQQLNKAKGALEDKRLAREADELAAPPVTSSVAPVIPSRSKNSAATGLYNAAVQSFVPPQQIVEDVNGEDGTITPRLPQTGVDTASNPNGPQGTLRIVIEKNGEVTHEEFVSAMQLFREEFRKTVNVGPNQNKSA